MCCLLVLWQTEHLVQDWTFLYLSSSHISCPFPYLLVLSTAVQFLLRTPSVLHAMSLGVRIWGYASMHLWVFIQKWALSDCDLPNLSKCKDLPKTEKNKNKNNSLVGSGFRKEVSAKVVCSFWFVYAQKPGFQGHKERTSQRLHWFHWWHSHLSR